MASVSELLQASRAASTAARSVQPGTTGDGSLTDSLKALGGAGLGAVAAVGNFLDLPGSSVRDLLAGENPFDQWLSPLSSDDRISGRDLLGRYGMRANRENGMSDWFSDPGEAFRDLAGFGAEVVTDPFGPVTGLIGKAAQGTKLATAVGSAASRAHPLAKAIGRGSVNVFDTLPAKATRPLVDAGKSVALKARSIFSPLSQGATSAGREKFLRQARSGIMEQQEKFTATTTTLLHSLRTEGPKYNFHIVASEDPLVKHAGLDTPGSDADVLANNDAFLREMLEPSVPGVKAVPRVRKGDIMGVPGSEKHGTVEVLHTNGQGVPMVKLVGHKEFVPLDTLTPISRAEWRTVPEALKPQVAAFRSQLDESVRLAEESGSKIPRWRDLVEFYPRHKGDDLRAIEQELHNKINSWRRPGHVLDMDNAHHRDQLFEGFTKGSPGVNQFFTGEGEWQFGFDALDKYIRAINPSSEFLNAKGSKGPVTVMPDHIGPRHLSGIAKSLDMSVEDLWKVLSPEEMDGPDFLHINQAIPRLQVMRAQVVKEVDAGTMPSNHYGRGDWKAYKDVLEPDKVVNIKHRVFEQPFNATTATVDRYLHDLSTGKIPDVSDPRYREYYLFSMANKAELDRLVPKTFSGEYKPPVPENVTQPRDLGDSPATPRAMQPVKLADLDPQMPGYDKLKEMLDAGKPVLRGRRVRTKGAAAEDMFVTPHNRHDYEVGFTKNIDSMKEQMFSDPLTQAEVVVDQFYRAIKKDHSQDIKQWMPVADESGKLQAVTVDGDTLGLANGSAKQYQEAVMDLGERISNGSNLTKFQKTILRLDDDSLDALHLKEAVTGHRKAYLDETGEELAQDLSIPLADRYRGLAEELAFKAERRETRLYGNNPFVEGRDYVNSMVFRKNWLDSFRQHVNDVRDELGDGDIIHRTGDVQRSWKDQPKGVPLSELFDDKIAGESFNRRTFTDLIAKDWIEKGHIDAPAEGTLLEGYKYTNQPGFDAINRLRLDPETVETMKTMAAANMEPFPEMGPLMRMVQTVNTWFKSWVLMHPATAIRDAVGSVVNGTAVGDVSPLAYKRYGHVAAQMAMGKPADPGEIPELLEHLKNLNLPNTPHNRGVAMMSEYAAHNGTFGVHPNNLTADSTAMSTSGQVEKLLDTMPSGKGPIQGLKDMWKTKGSVNPFAVPGTWTTEGGKNVQRSTGFMGAAINNAIRSGMDDSIRLSMAMEYVHGQGMKLKDAFRRVDFVLGTGDPRKFSRVENQILKPLIPFYGFMSRTIPMFMQEMVVNPGGKLGMMIRGTRLAQGDGYVPFQYQDTASIPVGQTDDGTLKFLTSMGFMHEDAVKYAGNTLQGDVRGLLQKMISSGNPQLKWLIEYSTNTSLFSQGPMGGRRLDDLDPGLGRILVNTGLREEGPSGRPDPVGGPLLESLVAASPVSRLISTARILSSPADRVTATEKVIRMLTGAKIESVTAEQKIRDIRDRINAMQVKAGAHPLTTVIGAGKVKERLLELGDVEGAAAMQAAEDELSRLRKEMDRVAPSEKKVRKARNNRAVLERLASQFAG